MTTGAQAERDAVARVASLAALYPSPDDVEHAGARVRQRSLPMLERSIRRDIARHVLAHRLPDLLAELLEAATDDLTASARSPVTDAAPTDAEAAADAELRVVEAVEHYKAVLDAAGLQALARLHSCIESIELARATSLGTSLGTDLATKRPAGWLDADRLTMLEVTTATGLARKRSTTASAWPPTAPAARPSCAGDCAPARSACTAPAPCTSRSATSRTTPPTRSSRPCCGPRTAHHPHRPCCAN